jgi:hypothetical protein
MYRSDFDDGCELCEWLYFAFCMAVVILGFIYA